MILTETEAKTRWCPFAHYSHEHNRGTKNKEPIPSIGARCLGSGCMLWRWSSLTDQTGFCGMGTHPAWNGNG